MLPAQYRYPNLYGPEPETPERTGGLMGEPVPVTGGINPPTPLPVEPAPPPTQAGTNPPVTGGPAPAVPLPTGPMPTIPPGGIEPTPVAAPRPPPIMGDNLPPLPAPTSAPAPAPAPLPAPPPDPNWQNNIRTPAPQVAPSPMAPLPMPDGNWQARPANQQALPPMPGGGGAVNMPPQTQGTVYGPTGDVGFNPFAGLTNNAGTGSASVGDFGGAFGAGDRGAVTRDVQQNELSGYQLDQLIRGDSQYIRNAELGAREASSERGMMMGSMAVGAARRAAIDAAQPFAMQQADAYGRTASENMSAGNVDAQADQGQYRDMAARDIALRAQMEDAGLGRKFQAGQAQNEQLWRSGESSLDRRMTQSENAANRTFQSGERAAGQNWQSGESAYERAFRGDQAGLDRYQQTSERIGNQNWQSGETAQERAWRDYQASLDRTQQTNERYGSQNFQSGERIGTQNYQSGEAGYERAWRDYQAGLERNQQTSERLGTQGFQRDMSEDEQAWRTGEAGLDRTYNADQAVLNRNESRYNSYFNSVSNREANTSTVLNSIYSNPNLTPQQQEIAAANARAMLGSIYDGYNAVLSNGIPPIFSKPYPMQFAPQPAPPSAPQPAPAPAPLPAPLPAPPSMAPTPPPNYGQVPDYGQVPWRDYTGIAQP